MRVPRGVNYTGMWVCVRLFCLVGVHNGVVRKISCRLHVYVGLARTIYTAYIRYFWLENHQIYGVYIRMYTVLANPTHMYSGKG